MPDELEQLELAGLERPKSPTPIELPLREPEQYPAPPPPPPLLVVGVTLCAVCRTRDADGVLEPFTFGLSSSPLPTCFDCLELFLERDAAAELGSAELVASLPAIRRESETFRPRPPAYRPQPGDDAKLEELRRQWLDYQERHGAA